MRIRGASSSSSDSSNSTSVTPSSTLYFSSSSSFSSIDSITRCEGLDLLVKAVLHVAGSLLVVPFTQRRVIRRRKRSLKFSKVEFIKREEDEDDDNGEEIEVILNDNKRKREMALPLKYHDSDLQPWKRCVRRRRTMKTDRSLG